MRPDIPKRFLQKILTAQGRVLDQRSRIKHAEESIRRKQAEIDLFDRDPVAYAIQQYGGHLDADSYPVVTRTGRLRDDIERNIERRPIRAVDLHNAERALAAIEAEALETTLALAPSRGRMPWPASLPAFIGHETVTKIDDDALAMVRDENDARERTVALEIARRETEHEQARQSVAQGIEQRRGSPSPMVDEWQSKIRLGNGSHFTVTSTTTDGPEILQKAIARDHAGSSFGHIWDLAVAIFQSGVDWPGWEIYYARFRETCRASFEPDASGNEVSADRLRWVQHIQTISKQHYCPEDVRLPDFVDGPPAKPSKLKEFVRELGLSAEQAEDWFLRTWMFARIGTLQPPGYSAETLAAMEYVGLLARGSDITTPDAIELLKYSGMRNAMGDLGLMPGKTRDICRKSLLALSFEEHDRVRKTVDKHQQKDVWVMNTPPGLSWTELHSWRQQIRGMAVAITDLYAHRRMPHQDRADLLA
jgi:hypothetical protein